MVPAKPAINPTEAWAEMSAHLEWAERLCLCFLFSDSSDDLAELRQLLEEAWQTHAAPVRIVAANDPATASREVLQAMLDHGARSGDTTTPVWVEVLAVDQHGSTAWDAARATMLARLNESREWLAQDFARPLIICLPANWALRAPVIAPDLWHVRSYTARLRSPVVGIKVQAVRENIAPGTDTEAQLRAPREAYQQAQQRLKAADDTQRLARQREVMVVAGRLGNTYLKQGHIEAASRHFQEMLAIGRQLHAKLGDDTHVLRDVAAALINLGNAESAAGGNDAALNAYRESLAIGRQLQARLGDSPQTLRDVAMALQKMGDAESAAGHTDAALSAYRESLAIQRQLSAMSGNHAQVSQDILLALKNVRTAETAAGKRGPSLLVPRDDSLPQTAWQGISGGALAIRGFVVQTLIALLEIIEADPPFIDITLDPADGDGQFDFVWRNAEKQVAVQVKSSINPFSKTAVAKWAKALHEKSNSQQCELILVGEFERNMTGVNQIGAVTIKRRSLDIRGLYEQAAFRVFQFMHAQQQAAETPDSYLTIVGNLIGHLLHYSAIRETLTRAQFIELMIRCVKETTAIQASTPPAIEIDRIINYAPQHLIGRELDTGLLNQAWKQVLAVDTAGETSGPRPHIISFVALGGEGKTALVAHWLTQLAQQGWPDCRAVFAWSFYSQGSELQMASSDLFIHEALQFFGEAELAASSQSGVDKARRLAQLVGERRVLLILDGLERLQYAPSAAMRGEFKDMAMRHLLRALAVRNRGLCVLTTRYSIQDLKAFRQTTAPEYKLLRLSTDAGAALLRQLGVKGAKAELVDLVESIKGHALSIQLFGAYLRDAHGGDIRRRDRVTLAAADEEMQGGHAGRVMDAYVAWLEGDGDKGRQALAMLKLLGLFDRPANAECIGALLQAPAIVGLTDNLIGLDEASHNTIYRRLADAGLLTVQRDDSNGLLLALDAHPLLREYFAHVTKTQQPDAWKAAHRRLYTWLCERTKDKPQPTLDDLQPLYQAVVHGCLAEMQQQVFDDAYMARIQRRNEFYSTHKLGAFGTDLGAVACFFEQPWQRVSPTLRQATQAWLLYQAAFCLRALGRLTDAVEPMQAGLARDVMQEDWKQAASGARNLSELQLTQGDLARAVQYAEQAVGYADRSGDAFQRLTCRAVHADALHQVGKSIAAMALFSEAEAMQADMQPDYPLLYSIGGFHYSDLLLAVPEAIAWQYSAKGYRGLPGIGGEIPSANTAAQPTRMPAAPPGSVQGDVVRQIQTCNMVSQRAAQTLAWAEQNNIDILTIALDYLTLGRAALFAAILAGQPIGPCQAALKLAVDGLRRAGYMNVLPRGLLTRAWLFAHTSHHIGPDSAQTDLDEAWEIAEAGPMPLFMADIHLHRAGLFHHITPYPWQSPADDAREARGLIEKHGYLRRMADLAAVEQAIGIKTLL